MIYHTKSAEMHFFLFLNYYIIKKKRVLILKLNKYELLNRSYSFVSFDNGSLTIAVKNKEEKTVDLITLDDVQNIIGNINMCDKMITKVEDGEDGKNILDLIVDDKILKMEYTDFKKSSIKIYENYITLYEDELIEMSGEWESEFSTFGYLKNEAKDLENQRLIIAMDTNINKPVGYLYGHRYKTINASATIPKESNVFEVEEIFVKKDYRSKGIGTLMFNALEEKIKNEGIDFITLTTATKDYKKILHFYIDELGMTFWHARLFKNLNND
jgi:GNAT superfamily N-acetyltransferase